jgi:hypothetical protein
MYLDIAALFGASVVGKEGNILIGVLAGYKR